MIKPSLKAGNIVDGKQTTTVMCIPSTKGRVLTSMLKEKEEEMVRITKFRVKYQEAGGVKHARMFSTNLAAGEACGRMECQSCESKTEGRLNCKLQSILY